MKYDNSLFYIEKINPRPTKKFVYRFEFFVALSFLEKKGQRRKEKQARGKEGSTANRLNKRELRKTNPKDGFLFCSVSPLAHHLPPPYRSPTLARLSLKNPSFSVAYGTYRPMCSSFRYAHAFLFAVLRVVYTMR